MTLGIYYEHMLAAARQRGTTLPALCAQVRALGYEAVAPQAAHIVRDAGLLPMLSSAGLRAEGIYERFLFESKTQTAQQAAQVLAVCERAGAQYLLAVLPMLRGGETDRNGALYARRRDMLATGLETLCAQAARCGITVLLEPFDSLFSPSAHAAELLWYFARVEGLFCAFDTGNPVVCGEECGKNSADASALYPHCACQGPRFLRQRHARKANGIGQKGLSGCGRQGGSAACRHFQKAAAKRL